jgi:hypothetical protein
MPRHDEMGRDEATSRRQETPNDRHCDRERRIGYDPKRSLGKTEVVRVDLDHDHGTI